MVAEYGVPNLDVQRVLSVQLVNVLNMVGGVGV